MINIKHIVYANSPATSKYYDLEGDLLRKMKQELLLRIVVHAVVFAEGQISDKKKLKKRATIVTTTATVSPSSYVAPAREEKTIANV
ncbi:hypothetical protein F8388_005129 [Cannabis sativa]|uniref:Uncharacterized protein n=2 Tax=Cannabis sativa TaxID=3483 RepID=A0A7J6DUX5_CANSA|nr:hypothetical protein F8388_005129 [Cannabis sativa]